MTSLYLLHFDRPLANAKQGSRHYLGFSKDRDPSKRIEAHRTGRSGAAFTMQARREGIAFVVAATWIGLTQEHERRVKRQKHLARYCPICHPTGTAPMPPQSLQERRTADLMADVDNLAAFEIRTLTEAPVDEVYAATDRHSAQYDDVDMEDLPY